MATYFKQKKCNFTMIPNEVLRDKNLSRKAKGLYAEIYSYITIPNFKLSKSYLMKQGLEGETAFNSMWNELKEKGYLKQYRIRSYKSDNGFVYEYDLLDKPDLTTPYLINIKINGSQGVVKTIENRGSLTDESCKNIGNTENKTLDFVPPRFSTIYNSHMVQNWGNYNNTDLNNTNLNNTISISKKESSGTEGENKERKISFNDIIEEYTQNEQLRSELKEHLKTRKAKKAPFTNRALILSLNKLDTLANTDEEKIIIVQNSIMNGWSSFFKLNNDHPQYLNNKKCNSFHQEPASYNIDEYESLSIFDD